MARKNKVDIVVTGYDRFSKKVGPILKSMDRIGNKAKKAGKILSLGITAPVVAAGVGAFNASKNLNEAMANVATLIPGQAKRLEHLKKTVQDLSVETGKSSRDIADGLFQVISAFGDTADTEKLLTTNTKAAIAGQATVSEALALTSAVTKAYGDTSAEAAMNVADLAFKTNELGQTTFAEMAVALPRVAALAKEAGVTLTEMFSIISTASGVTGNTSEVITQISSALTALVKVAPGSEMSRGLRELGYKGGEAGKKLVREKGLVGAMRSLNFITKQFDKSLATLLGRKEGLLLTSALIGAQADTYATKSKKILKAQGAMMKANKEQMEGINKAGVEYNRMIAQGTRLAQNIGDRMAPALMKLFSATQKVLHGFDNMNPALQKTLIVLAAIAASIGPLLLGLSGVLFILGPIITHWGLLAAVMAPVIKGVVALTTAIIGVNPMIWLVTAAVVSWGSVIMHLADEGNSLMDVLHGMGIYLKSFGKLIYDHAIKPVGRLIKKLAKLAAMLGSGAFGKMKEFFNAMRGGDLSLFGEGDKMFSREQMSGMVNGKKSEFEARLIIEGGSPKNRVEVTKGEMDIFSDTGGLLQGVQ